MPEKMNELIKPLGEEDIIKRLTDGIQPKCILPNPNHIFDLPTNSDEVSEPKYELDFAQNNLSSSNSLSSSMTVRSSEDAKTFNINP